MLNDIYEFQEEVKKKTENKIGEFYCLQPIVVLKKGENRWEVIDSQQRLTTILILLSSLKDALRLLKLPTTLFTLEYETREKEEFSSKEFLDNIVNRSESGKFGKTFSDILNKNQYNAVGKPAYNDPFGFVDNLRDGAGTKEFFKAKSSAIIGNLENSFSEAFKANKGIGTPVSGGTTFYVSPPLKSTHFNSNKQLTNITSSISGLVGISGVWKLNK